MIQFVRFRVAGNEVEHPCRVLGNAGIIGEKGQVLIDPCGYRVIVAGADVAVGLELAMFALDDHGEF